MTSVRVKRVYEPAAPEDGHRFLVERLWPRGMREEDLRMEAWLKDVAPSPALRTWFAHDPAKWAEFQRRYRAELARHPEALDRLLESAQETDVTLLFSARDVERNSAVLLRDYLKERISAMPPRRPGTRPRPRL